MTELDAALRTATARLAAAGVPAARHDAEQLAAHVLGVPRGDVVRAAARGEQLPAGPADAYDRVVDRRARREPLQHITGRAAFRHLDLAVGPGVFVPRPETEIVVDACLRRLGPGGPPRLVVDLGAGSGAIALALATERPGTVVYAVERDAAAYGWLRRNVSEVGAGGQVRCLLADLAVPPPELCRHAGAVDLVVSNPPYIPLGAVPVDPEVAGYDPGLALWGGPDGLDAVRAVSRTAADLLRPGGDLVIEHGDRQADAVGRLLVAGGWSDVADSRDLTGRDRVATARRPRDRPE